MYVSFKVQMLWDRLQLCVQAVRTATRCEAQYGQYATADEVMEAGGSCSICQVPFPAYTPAEAPSITRHSHLLMPWLLRHS